MTIGDEASKHQRQRSPMDPPLRESELLSLTADSSSVERREQEGFSSHTDRISESLVT